MELALDICSWVLLIAGSVFCVISSVGLIRMPEFYTRTHAAGVADSFGAALILLGLSLQATDVLVVIKLLSVLVFLLFASPIASHALVKAAYARGVRFAPGSRADVDPH